MLNQNIEHATRQWTLAQPVVSAFISSMVSDFRQRDDILQDVAVAVLENYESFDQSRSFNSWAVGIARNRIRNYFRNEKTSPLLFDTETVENIAAGYDALPVERIDSLWFLKECLKELDGRAKEICDLRYQDDMKPAAIGKHLGVAPNSISKTLERIRKQLKKCISVKAALEGPS